MNAIRSVVRENISTPATIICFLPILSAQYPAGIMKMTMDTANSAYAKPMNDADICSLSSASLGIIGPRIPNPRPITARDSNKIVKSREMRRGLIRSPFPFWTSGADMDFPAVSAAVIVVLLDGHY